MYNTNVYDFIAGGVICVSPKHLVDIRQVHTDLIVVGLCDVDQLLQCNIIKADRLGHDSNPDPDNI